LENCVAKVEPDGFAKIKTVVFEPIRDPGECAAPRFSASGTLALFLVQRANDGQLTVNLRYQCFDTAKRQLIGSLLELMAKLGETDSAHVAAAAFEAMGSGDERDGITGFVQLPQTLLRIGKKGIQQQWILIFHDFLQCAQHIVIQMNLSHLLAP
jgi:hypothetical protein